MGLSLEQYITMWQHVIICVSMNQTVDSLN